MKIKNKKAVILCGLFVAVLAVGYVNYLLTSGAANAGVDGQSEVEISAQASETGAETADAFSEYKEKRTATRAQEMSYIDAVITSAETDEQTKAEAQQQKLALAANMETELITEGIIQTKLGLDSVITVQEGSVNVVVDQTELTDSQVAQIVEIMQSETGEDATNIKIMPKSS